MKGHKGEKGARGDQGELGWIGAQGVKGVPNNQMLFLITKTQLCIYELLAVI